MRRREGGKARHRKRQGISLGSFLDDLPREEPPPPPAVIAPSRPSAGAGGGPGLLDAAAWPALALPPSGAQVGEGKENYSSRPRVAAAQCAPSAPEAGSSRRAKAPGKSSSCSRKPSNRSQTPSAATAAARMTAAKAKFKILPERRRRLTTLKKRILQGRASNWEALMGSLPDAARNRSLGATALTATGTKVSELGESTILLEALIQGDELVDDDEYEETLTNIREMCEFYGEVKCVDIPREGSRVGRVTVEFVDAWGAEEAVRGLNGRTVGGEQISATLLKKDYDPLEPDDAIYHRVRVKNLVDAEDMEDQDSYEEVCEDVRRLVQKFGTVSLLELPLYSTDCKHFDVVVGYRAECEADAALSGLDRVKIAGKILEVNRENTPSRFLAEVANSTGHGTCVLVENWVCPGDDFSDEEEYMEVVDNFRDIASQFGEIGCISVPRSAGVVRIEYLGAESAERAARSLSQKIVQGRKLSAYLERGGRGGGELRYGGSASEEQRLLLNKLSENFAAAIPFEVRRQKVPLKYGDAATVPKLPGETNNLIRDSPMLAPCPPEVDALLASMMEKLYGYQEKARRIGGGNAKRGRRLVMGLREVMRGVKVSGIKMIIIAPNIDASGMPGALDDKVSEIVNAAAEKSIPIICGLSKRRMGKALGKSIKVSIVGIYSFEGAHDIRKNLEKFLVEREQSQ